MDKWKRKSKMDIVNQSIVLKDEISNRGILMKKVVTIAASLLLAATPVTVLAGKGSSKSGDDDQPAKVYDPCATSNPALAGKGCLFYVNGQIVTANGDGTFTTAAGNIFDANGKLVGTVGGHAAATAAKSGVPNTGEADNTAYYVMMGGALIVMAGAGYVLATNKN